MKLSATLFAAVAVVMSSVSLAQAQFPMPTVPMPGSIHSGYPMPGSHLGRPGYPVIVTPNQFDGLTPWGGVNTRNDQINNTYFDYGRNASQHNGTRRMVNRPVYDSYGRVTGYEQGYEWNNSFTGQLHSDITTVTNNGLGGNHQSRRQTSNRTSGK